MSGRTLKPYHKMAIGIRTIVARLILKGSRNGESIFSVDSPGYQPSTVAAS